MEWRKCSTHPDVDPTTMWGCPDCVAFLRGRVRQLEDQLAKYVPQDSALGNEVAMRKA